MKSNGCNCSSKRCGSFEDQWTTGQPQADGEGRSFVSICGSFFCASPEGVLTAVELAEGDRIDCPTLVYHPGVYLATDLTITKSVSTDGAVSHFNQTCDHA